MHVFELDAAIDAGLLESDGDVPACLERIARLARLPRVVGHVVQVHRAGRIEFDEGLSQAAGQGLDQLAVEPQAIDRGVFEMEVPASVGQEIAVAAALDGDVSVLGPELVERNVAVAIDHRAADAPCGKETPWVRSRRFRSWGSATTSRSSFFWSTSQLISLPRSIIPPRLQVVPDPLHGRLQRIAQFLLQENVPSSQPQREELLAPGIGGQPAAARDLARAIGALQLGELPDAVGQVARSARGCSSKG